MVASVNSGNRVFRFEAGPRSLIDGQYVEFDDGLVPREFVESYHSWRLQGNFGSYVCEGGVGDKRAAALPPGHLSTR